MAHTLAVVVCDTLADIVGMSGLYAVHDHVPGGGAERGVFAAEFLRSTEGLYFPREGSFGLPR